MKFQVVDVTSIELQACAVIGRLVLRVMAKPFIFLPSIHANDAVKLLFNQRIMRGDVHDRALSRTILYSP